MRVGQIMKTNVQTINESETISRAAYLMAEEGIGALPVLRDGHLTGMLTDRDIVVRGLCYGDTDQLRVKDVMSSQVFYCHADQDVKDVVSMMAQLKIRRVPVLDKNEKMVGILSFSDLVKRPESWREASEILQQFQYSA